MLTSQTLLDHAGAEPFRPFRLLMATGRAFEIRHPEMIRVLRSSAIIFEDPGTASDAWETVSLMSIDRLEPSAH